MNPEIGIMQGRLSKFDGYHIQSFPTKTRDIEFMLAKKVGLTCIEWVYRQESESKNPLATETGIHEIKKVINQSNVNIWAITADYYMSNRLISHSGIIQEEVLKHLFWLLNQAAIIGANHVMAPFVDDSKLTSENEINAMVTMLKTICPVLEATGIELHMETDLETDIWKSILMETDHPMIKICYDVGDRAYLGYDLCHELNTLGPWIGSVHIKDRMLGGVTVPLGQGNADFKTFFRDIYKTQFSGPFILQAAREQNISELDLAIRNRKFIESYLNHVI